MKKVLSFFLSILCLSSIFSLAENSTSYISETGMFSIEIPADFYALNHSVYTTLEQENMLAILEKDGVTDSMMKCLKNNSVEYLIGPNEYEIVDITVKPNCGISMEELLAINTEGYDDYLLEYYSYIDLRREELHIYDTKVYGKNTFTGFEIYFDSFLAIAQYTIIDESKNEYNFYFNCIDENTISHILSSFTPVQEQTTNIYVSDTGLFAFEYPVDYHPLNQSIVEEFIGSAESRKALADAGLDFSIYESLRYKPEEHIYNTDYSGFMNITYQTDAGITMSLLKRYEQEFFNSFKEQYIDTGFSENSIIYNGILDYGANSYFSYSLKLLDSEIIQYITVDDNGTMYIFNATSFDEASTELILTTFTVLH